ncbi:MAG: Ig-like domain-containing protein [Clostridia bacterium]|nr:Ig-like domain-containing protein [Clostridia bacterium]
MTYKNSNASVAGVSEDGTVTALMRGETTITVTTHNGLKAAAKIKVYDPEYPEALNLTNPPGVMWAGGKGYQLEYTIEPAAAKTDVKWTSSKPEVATVDKNGKIMPLSFGYTTISGVSAKNSKAVIKFTLGVQDENRILVIPERTTQEDGISANLKKIEAIRKSAIAQVDALRAKGTIKTKDANKRKDMINNIFRDYAFPWKTTSLQKYWRKANSENGAKDFKTDRVYYGMPYISGSGTNRTYSASKALSEKRYTDSGNGYYLLNRKKLLNGKYVGSDCSGLVNAAIWGHSSSHIDDRTVEIAQSKAYKTIKGFDKLRPGDLICLEYRHVVMFLYYADNDKSKIMIIENGGAEAGTNTVHCAVHNVSYYKKEGYKVRRLASLG